MSALHTAKVNLTDNQRHQECVSLSEETELSREHDENELDGGG